MALTAFVYKNQSLSEEERASIAWIEVESGEPMIEEDSDPSIFLAADVFIGNPRGLAALRWELEKSCASGSEAIREFVVYAENYGTKIEEPNISLIVSECSSLLANERLQLSDFLRDFLHDFCELAKTAVRENSSIFIR